MSSLFSTENKLQLFIKRTQSNPAQSQSLLTRFWRHLSSIYLAQQSFNTLTGFVSLLSIYLKSEAQTWGWVVL